MILDAALPVGSLRGVPEVARLAERLGVGCLWASETQRDPFLPGPLVYEHTRRLAFGTAIAVAFARSPTLLAHTAWDLAEQSGGRFILGLGTQVRAHVQRRFGMPWPDSAVAKLREQIQAIRALWRCWQTGERLSFRGRYHTLTLMSPFFNPGPIPHPEIPIYVAGVNPGLVRLAGEVADGFCVHPLHSPEYLRRVVLPALEAGAGRAGRSHRDVTVSASVMIATNPQEREFLRSQVAFYASTPSYRTVLAVHGWEEIGERLSALARAGRWSEMSGLIPDEMLKAFCVVGEEVAEIPELLRARYEGLVDRITPYFPLVPGEREELWRTLARTFGRG
ncbi:MAG: TIGR03617 family F420-dependent LLM class oxidoreductase [Armatimonadota bacterium]|nr:TIGR03617 family F420-dependent LLM class oxidoreductase [Armatimonadota bacterium]MDR7571025.1 TIGR03617 family F420-dependent LLM class oxidoreductase [Armatimonadota bacterium]MDR7614441.1 TIGR03617 family F420-dependent LLM class oxidoreductase [Armatimonadota bacterium]